MLQLVFAASPEFGFDSNALASGGKITEEERRKTSVERHMEAHSAATAPFQILLLLHFIITGINIDVCSMTRVSR